MPCQRGEPGQYAHLATQREGGVNEERRWSNGFWTLSGKEDNLHFLLKVKQKYIERFGFDNLTVPF